MEKEGKKKWSKKLRKEEIERKKNCRTAGECRNKSRDKKTKRLFTWWRKGLAPERWASGLWQTWRLSQRMSSSTDNRKSEPPSPILAGWYSQTKDLRERNFRKLFTSFSQNSWASNGHKVIHLSVTLRASLVLDTDPFDGASDFVVDVLLFHRLKLSRVFYFQTSWNGPPKHKRHNAADLP